MPVLHFRITKAQQTIELSRELKSQNFTLRRVVVIREPNTTDSTSLNGGLAIDLDFWNGFEMLSNLNSNVIYVPLDQSVIVNDNPRYDLNFNGETIHQSFGVKVRDYKDASDNAAVVFWDQTGAPAEGEIMSIDMYFEFDDLFDYTSY